MQQEKILFLWWSVEDEFESEEAALQSGYTAADTSVSLVRWQQGEQTAAAGLGVVVFVSHLTDITDPL